MKKKINKIVANIFDSLTLSQSKHVKQGFGGPDFESSMVQVPVQTEYQSTEKKIKQ